MAAGFGAYSPLPSPLPSVVGQCRIGPGTGGTTDSRLHPLGCTALFTQPAGNCRRELINTQLCELYTSVIITVGMNGDMCSEFKLYVSVLFSTS